MTVEESSERVVWGEKTLGWRRTQERGGKEKHERNSKGVRLERDLATWCWKSGERETWRREGGQQDQMCREIQGRPETPTGFSHLRTISSVVNWEQVPDARNCKVETENAHSTHTSNFSEVWMSWWGESWEWRWTGTRAKERNFRKGKVGINLNRGLSVPEYQSRPQSAQLQLHQGLFHPPFLFHLSLLFFYHIHMWATFWEISVGPRMAGSLASKTWTKMKSDSLHLY